MKQTQNLLMTTMSTSLFNISESSPSKTSKKKSRTPNLTPNRDMDKSRSMTYRSNGNFIDLSNSPSISIIRRSSDTNLYDRLYNQAKEIKEKIDLKKNEFLQQIKKEAIPKIQAISKKIERKQELFPERLYPYHKLNKLDTEEDNSFEYAHVATVRSNPLGISHEFDNDDFRNNIDSIFCDDEEIKNLYGNKPSFVKIYRGIKHRKREQFPFKPTLSKNTDKIVKNMELGAQALKKSQSSSIDENVIINQSRRSSCKEFIRKFDGVEIERDNSANSAAGIAVDNNKNVYRREFGVNQVCCNWGRNTISAMPINSANGIKNAKFGNNDGNLINIDFIYENEFDIKARNNSNNNNNNNLKVNNSNPNSNVVNNKDLFNNMNTNNTYVNNNNPILISAAYARNNNADIANSNINNINNFQNKNNNDNNNKIISNSNININNNFNITNNINKKINENTNNSKTMKKTTPSYFDNPSEKIKSRYEMELKKSYTSNYYNLNKQKSEKLNPQSLKISNKLYFQGINFMKKKEKITEEKRKSVREEYKNYSFKPNLNITSSTAFANTNNNRNNLINYNSSTSSVNFASNNLSGIAKKNSNDELESKVMSNVVNNDYKYKYLVELQSAHINKTSSLAKANMTTNNSKNSAVTHWTNKTASTNYTKINPNSSAYAKNAKSINNKPLNKFINDININDNSNNSNNKFLNKLNNNNNSNNNNSIGRSNNFFASKQIRNSNYSFEEYKTPNTVNNNSILNNNQSSLLQTPGGENRSCSSLSKSVNASFYERSKKWKDSKEQKAEKQLEEKTKKELVKCSFSPKIIPKSKNFFEEKLSYSCIKENHNNNYIFQKNDYITRVQNSYYKKKQDMNFQSKIFCENAKNSKMKITLPQEFNFSQLISRKCRENLNKARVLHRAESVKNYREKLSTKIFFNQPLFEIEDDINSANNPGIFNNDSNNYVASFDNRVVGSVHNAERVVNRVNPESVQQLVNKNMNINLNVNIMMNNK
jgi:hypothetical protein